MLDALEFRKTLLRRPIAGQSIGSDPFRRPSCMVQETPEEALRRIGIALLLYEDVQQRRDADAAERFFRCLLDQVGNAPERIVTDKLASYAVAKQRMPALAAARHLYVRAAARLNNRAEQSHQPTRVRERRMQRFKSSAQAQRFLTAFSRVCNLFRPRRHLLAAAEYRTTMQARFRTWSENTAVVCA